MTLPDVLRRIVERRRERFGLPARGARADLEPAGSTENDPGAADSGPADARGGGAKGMPDNPFLAALRPAGPRPRPQGGEPVDRRFRIIAEVKMGSPRLGSLAGRVDPLAQARLYATGGAAALSVVVEPDFFHGSYDLLSACRAASGLPAIAKDFVVHPHQLELARTAGADAVLLIAALYAADELASWARRARAHGLVPLVETHTAGDLARLSVAGGPWELVGVNNRDLRSFEVDLAHSIELLPRLPVAAVKVAESGIGSGAEVARLAAAGFDAFLVGESLLLADDPAAKLADLVAGGRADVPVPASRTRADDQPRPTVSRPARQSEARR